MELPSIRHGVEGIEDDIRQHLDQLAFIGENRVKVIRDLAKRLYAHAVNVSLVDSARPSQFERFLKRRSEVNGPNGFGPLEPDRSIQALYDHLSSFSRGVQDVDQFQHLGI